MCGEATLKSGSRKCQEEASSNDECPVRKRVKVEEPVTKPRCACLGMCDGRDQIHALTEHIHKIHFSPQRLLDGKIVIVCFHKWPDNYTDVLLSSCLDEGVNCTFALLCFYCYVFAQNKKTESTLESNLTVGLMNL